MTKCKGKKRDGTECNFNTKDGSLYCGFHSKQNIPDQSLAVGAYVPEYKEVNTTFFMQRQMQQQMQQVTTAAAMPYYSPRYPESHMTPPKDLPIVIDMGPTTTDISFHATKAKSVAIFSVPMFKFFLMRKVKITLRQIAWLRIFFQRIFTGKLLETKFDKSCFTFLPCCKQAVRSFSCGGNHQSILTFTGLCYTWGKNNFGQLGLNDLLDRAEPTLLNFPKSIVKVSCGGEHTAFLTKEKELYMFGSDEHFQLGLIKTHQEGMMLRQKYKEYWTKEPIRILKDTYFRDVSCGGNHTGAITMAGKLLMFGESKYGELTKTDHYNFYPPFEIFESGGIVIKKVVCGESRTACITNENKLLIFGRGTLPSMSFHEGIKYLDSGKPNKILGETKVSNVIMEKERILINTCEGKLFLYGIDMSPILLDLPMKIKKFSFGCDNRIYVLSGKQLYLVEILKGIKINIKWTLLKEEVKQIFPARSELFLLNT